MEELLESFLTAGLGLELKCRIEDVCGLPEVHVRSSHPSQERARVCAAWHTTLGRVTICGTYDPEHSHRVKGHAMWLEWWIPPKIHHEGWWRVEPKWPRDWIKGHGSPTS
jgi:hypothetical protein